MLIVFLTACISTKQVERIMLDKNQLYPVSFNGKWGFIDSAKQLVIDYQYQEASFFSTGLAVVKKGDMYGYIRTDNSWHIKPQFEKAYNFDDNCANVVKNGTESRINRKNQNCNVTTWTTGGCIPPARPASKSNHVLFKDGKYAIIYKHYTIAENESIPQIRTDTTEFVFDSVEEFSVYNLLMEKNGKYGLFNIYGKQVPRIISKVHEDDIFIIDTGRKTDSIVFQYDEVVPKYFEYYNDGVSYEVSTAAVRVENKWGFINGGGHVQVTPKYLGIVYFDETMAEVEYEANKTGYIWIRNSEEYF